MSNWIFLSIGGLVALILVLLVLVFVYDIVQRKHTILHNFPLIGHFRYMLEKIGPELRQYIVTDNDEERPFSRDQRTWVYASSKKQNNYFGFGTDNDLENSSNYLILKHSPFPKTAPSQGSPEYDPDYKLPCGKVWGGWRGREKAFTPASAICVSAMSYGSLGSAAVTALNKGCGIAGALHNTGEGGISKYHLQSGELILQLGTGYFGARNPDGTFSLDILCESVEKYPSIRAIEIKLSQGAKPGLGGHLPGKKVTGDISRARGIPQGQACVSPSGHSAFSGVDSMLDFIELIAAKTGLPVGIKSAVGMMGFWEELAGEIASTGRSPDFISIDGGEGGTGSAPLAFSDHVSLPFKIGFSRVHRVFSEASLDENIVFIGSGRLGFPIESLFSFAMGCDMVAVAREAIMSIGCIQAQRCHTGHCPAGIATHNKWLMAGLDPTLKAARLANYITTLRAEILKLTYAAGCNHPSELTLEHFEILDDCFRSRPATEVFA